MTADASVRFGGDRVPVVPGLTSTRSAEITVEGIGSDPLVAVRIRPGILQTLDDARENIEACVRVAGNRRCRLLLDISRAETIPADVRHYYSGSKLTDWFSSMALVVEASPLGRVMGNLYLRIARPGLPTRLFTDQRAAVAWLTQDRV